MTDGRIQKGDVNDKSRVRNVEKCKTKPGMNA